MEKKHFLITPGEFREVFADVHFVVTDTGVKKGYSETEPEDEFREYDRIYRHLKSGRSFVYQNDWQEVNFSIGVTKHMANIHYEPMSRLSIPMFSEPCIELALFPLVQIQGKLEKSYIVSQFPSHICGLLMSIPKKIEFFEEQCEKDVFADSETWDAVLQRIKGFTSILKVETTEGIRNTKIRISSEAKQDLHSFPVLRELGASIV